MIAATARLPVSVAAVGRSGAAYRSIREKSGHADSAVGRSLVERDEAGAVPYVLANGLAPSTVSLDRLAKRYLRARE